MSTLQGLKLWLHYCTHRVGYLSSVYDETLWLRILGLGFCWLGDSIFLTLSSTMTIDNTHHLSMPQFPHT